MEIDGIVMLGVVSEREGFVAALHDASGKTLEQRRADRLSELLQAVRGAAGERTLAVVAGVDDRATADALRDGLAGVRRLWVCRPWEAELAGALGGRAGVVVHSGMRAAVNAVGRQGNAIHVHQSEELLGEEGSALWLSTRALRMAVQGSTGRMQRSERLEQTLTRYFGADSLEELVVRFEGGHILPDEMAGFVSVMLHLAEYPDPEPSCRALLLQTARRLAKIVQTAAEQVPLSAPFEGSWTGFAMVAALLEAFRNSVEQYVAGVRWSAPRGDAGQGAALLARAALRQDKTGEQPPDSVQRLGDVTPATWAELIAHHTEE